jgi:hypothetical protein
MKSLMQFLLFVLTDVSTLCCACTTRDFKTISARVEHEGISFLTIALPNFCKDFERSLEIGFVDSTLFLGFKKSGPLPCLFRGLVSQVFDAGSGQLLEKPSHDAIFAVRQACLLYKKVNLPCTDKRIEAAFDGYIQCDQEVRDRDRNLHRSLYERFGCISDVLWGSSLQSVNLVVRRGTHVPRHGPGATAQRISGNRKFSIKEWHSRLDVFFPSDVFCIPSWNAVESLERIDFLEPDAERPVRVITVPKTLKTPRIIAIEPVCMQYTQQSILEILVPALERSPLLSGSLGFTDQRPNQELALSSSSTGASSTLDLSEASDRVSNLLVLRMLDMLPDLSGAVQSCRSTTADVPGHGVKPLAKFASMGSALCFPIESMVFLTIVLSAILRDQVAPVTLKSIKRALKGVRIYGDDIIVPTEYAHTVIRELSDFGLKVNTAKSFVTGKFRESCGMDAYDGTNVRPTYVRRLFPQSRHDTENVISLFSLYNQLYHAGMWSSAKYLLTMMKNMKIPHPCVAETSPVLGLHSVLGYETERMCDQLHRPLVFGYTVKSSPRSDPLDGYGALLKFFLKRGSDPFFDVKHLERYGRPERVSIKARWSPSY